MNITNITPKITPHPIIIHINAGRLGIKTIVILIIIGEIQIIVTVVAIVIIINIPKENHHHLPKIHFSTKVSITIPKKLKKTNITISLKKRTQKPKGLANITMIYDH